MCTSPNFIKYNNVYGTRTAGKIKPVEFVPHVDFDKFLAQSILEGFDFVPVACGHCLECRKAHAQEWADRCTLEASLYEDNYFITLTYDDAHTPLSGCQSTLRRKDFQDFMKRVRKAFPDRKLKVFYAGEYGDASSRPHYHAIIFNLPLDDLSYDFEQFINGQYKVFPRPNNKGQLMYSRTLYDLWNKQGNISVAKFSYATAAYVAQYVDKKVQGYSNEYYKKLGIEPEFIGMSKGLGLNGYDKKLFVNDIVYTPSFSKYGEKITKKQVELQHKRLVLPAQGEAKIVKNMPRYFFKQFEKEFPDLFLKYAAAKADANCKRLKLMNNTSEIQKELDARAHKNKQRFCLTRNAI